VDDQFDTLKFRICIESNLSDEETDHRGRHTAVDLRHLGDW
jgi:hypothetical protein